MFGQRKHTPKLRRRSNQQVSTAIAKLNSEKSTSYRRGRFFLAPISGLPAMSKKPSDHTPGNLAYIKSHKKSQAAILPATWFI